MNEEAVAHEKEKICRGKPAGAASNPSPVPGTLAAGATVPQHAYQQAMGSGGARASSKRKRRSCAKIFELTAPRPVSWADVLPPDLVGTVATFLDDSKSVWGYAITAGPDLSRTIKKAYLKRNFIFPFCRHRGKPSAFRAFLEANEDWREMYDKPGMLSRNDRTLFDIFFNNMVGAVSDGNVEIAMHLIEVRGYDIRGSNFPLHISCLAQLKLPMLEYLRGVDGIDARIKNVINGIIRCRE